MNAWPQIVRCFAGQASAPPMLPAPVRYPGPNLLLLTGRGFYPAIELRDDLHAAEVALRKDDDR